jgi:hypothetical protein
MQQSYTSLFGHMLFEQQFYFENFICELNLLQSLVNTSDIMLNTSDFAEKLFQKAKSDVKQHAIIRYFVKYTVIALISIRLGLSRIFKIVFYPVS